MGQLKTASVSVVLCFILLTGLLDMEHTRPLLLGSQPRIPTGPIMEHSSFVE